MEKVKLTSAQAEVFEKAINSLGVQSLVYEAVVNESGFCGDLMVLNELEPQDIVNAVKYGYEIEEPFKVGDWVHDKSLNRTAKIDERYKSCGDIWVDDDEHNFFFAETTRKATPEEIAAEKERRKWAAIGREVGEYHAGDFVRHKRYGIDMVEFIGQGIYLKALKRYCDKDEIEFICPVEHRFDMKEAE
jgi:hypothetical protein